MPTITRAARTAHRKGDEMAKIYEPCERGEHDDCAETWQDRPDCECRCHQGEDMGDESGGVLAWPHSAYAQSPE